MDKDKLRALAERCERAEGPNRELDAAIAVANGALRVHLVDGHATAFYANAASPLPFYTASLDAAMSLVPEGWFWRVDQGRNAGGACFKIDGHEQIFTLAATPALALIAAALRALSDTPDA